MSETHRDTAVGLYCENHSATFEPQEARRNDHDCPWCGEDASELTN